LNEYRQACSPRAWDDVIAQTNDQALGALHKRTHPPPPPMQKACEAAPA
jgi:hypothetical protein